MSTSEAPAATAAAPATVSPAGTSASPRPAPASERNNFFTDNPDLLFQFKNALDWGRVVPGLERGFKEEGGFSSVEEAVRTYEEALTLAGRYCATEVAPRAREVDSVEARLEDGEVLLSPAMKANLDKARELGILGPDVERKYGGWNFPMTVTGMMVEMLARACPATMVQYAFFASPARLILRFGTQAVKDRFAPPLLAGERSGAVCITESDAGSDVGNIRTRAELKDGVWRVTGRKQFISNGGADDAVVVARTDPASHGLAGLGLFVVQRSVQRDGRKLTNFTTARIEHKVCIRGSATCELVFEDSEAHILGEPGKGFEYIVSFMNEGRVGVAIQALGHSQAAYATALAYARGRVTMGKPISRHELIADQLVDMDVEIRSLRAMLYRVAAAQDRYTAAEREREALPAGDPRAADLEREMKGLARFGRELTPLLKYQAAEKCMEICKRALQIHGGYGVINDYEVERFYRDSVIFTLYEGTSQIQALMCLKDQMKWLRADIGGFFGRAAGAWLRRWLPGSRLERNLARVEWELQRSLLNILSVFFRHQFLSAFRAGKRGAALWKALGEAAEHEGVAYARLSAERLTRILSVVHAARILRAQAERAPERRKLADDFLARRLPEVVAWAEGIASGERSAIEFGESEGR